ncbi:MAG TPA: hypothetical protein VMN81_12145 [Vicinamibacterales bacterium]|nr:hypothetical protein [Vicinamibacterales bacterium]
MARGWESKNIESQQEEALSAREVKTALSAEEHARLEQRTAIELALAAKRSELAHATSDAHRAYLTRAINDLQRALDS